jgi:glutamate/aspartate transport system permease protein
LTVRRRVDGLQLELGDVFLQPTATGGGETYLGWMFYGFKMTIALSLSAWVIALAFGAVVGVLRTVPEQVAVRVRDRLRRSLSQHSAARAALPLVLRDARVAAREARQRFQAEQPDRAAVPSSMVCLALFTSARVAEQVRSGINSLPPGQKNAGLAMGFTLAADLSLCAAADGRAPDRAAADLGVSQHLQELGGLLDDRPARTGRPGPATGRLHAHSPTSRSSPSRVAYLLINVVVMFGMRWVEEHVRVPGYIGGK